MHDRDTLMKQFESTLSSDQLTISANILNELNNEYSEKMGLKRRVKWGKSFKSIGSNIPGIDSMLRRNVRYTVSNTPVTSADVVKSVKSYIKNGYQIKN
jgi:hypothetical protein